MTKWFTDRSVLTGALVLWALFVPFLIVIPRQMLFEVENAVLFSVSAGVSIGYSARIVGVLRQPIKSLHPGDALRIGVFLGWSATAVVFGILFYWRIVGKEDVIIDSALNALTRWVLITAGVMHLAASGGSLDGVVPLKSYLRAGVWVAAGLFLGCIVLMIVDFRLPVPRL